jgi:putative ABC transport system permease protein
MDTVMFRLTFKNVRANKVRFGLTTFGVVLAVSFVVAAFVLGDGLRRSFTDVSREITAGVDLQVRNASDFGDRATLPPATVTTVAAVDGVADAVPNIAAPDNAVRPIRSNGEIIPTTGPPQLAFNWIDNRQLSPFRMVTGAPPGAGEFTMDVDSAAKYGFAVGDTYAVMVPDGRVELRLSGTTSFGADNATLGAVLMQMDTAEASRLFGVDGIDNVAVQVADGADVGQVRKAIAAAVPSAEVVDNDTVRKDTAATFTDEIDVVGNILLGFGAVALFVSMFIISNTFGIVLSQRTRELALLRAVGADPAQIRRSVLGESLVMGVLASLGGIAGGILVAKGIDALFGVMGVDLVDYPLILANRTLIVAAVIGIGVTMLAAFGPARRAATIPPVAALSAGAEAGATSSRRRTLAGVALVAAGLASGAAGVAGAGPTAVTVAALAAGAVATFLGVTVLSPLAVGVVTGVVGWPVRKVSRVAGRMAQRNAARNRRRTATTAAALTVGLTLVTTALLVGASVKSAIGSTFDRSVAADRFVTDDLGTAEFPSALAGEIRRSDVVDAATGFTPVDVRIDGTVSGAEAFEFDQIGSLLDVDLTTGSFDRTVADPVVVSTGRAEALGAHVGDTLPIEFANGSRVEATVVGLFDDQTVLTADYLLDDRVLADAGVATTAAWLAIATAPGAAPADVAAMASGITERFPNASVETAAEFRHRVNGMIDSVLTMVNVMVALAVVIALIGIANTLALSVVERTRELGLVRAVGMTRRQVRRMVRYEAALVATFGAVVGVGLGLVFGAGVVTALPARFASGFTVPVSQIAVVVLVAAGAGVLAAWLPARRAGRLQVLDAIAH